MKKFFSLIVLIAVMLLNSSTFAANKGENSMGEDVPLSEMFLGGVDLYSNDKCLRIYGKPTWGNFGDSGRCGYGKGVVLYFKDNELIRIVVSENNGWKTPSGISVGMNISNAVQIYGEGFYRAAGTNKKKICYIYECQTRDGFPTLAFIFDAKTRIIEKILLGRLDVSSLRNHPAKVDALCIE